MKRIKTMFMSKKGGLTSTFASILSSVLDIIPSPIKILLFILLISVIASFIIPIFVGLFGYTCIDNTLYQVPMQNIITLTTSQISDAVREFSGFADFELPENPCPTGSCEYLAISEQCMNVVVNNSQTIRGYSALCTDCEAIGSASILFWNITLPYRSSNSICISDGFYVKEIYVIEPSIANFCYACAPPVGYYYNHTNALKYGWVFTIEDLSLLPYINLQDAYLRRVLNLGGVIRQQDKTEIVNIGCSSGTLSLNFFTIEIFNRLMWIYLIVAGMLIGLAFQWYSLMIGK